jgi:hypothetical protein
MRSRRILLLFVLTVAAGAAFAGAYASTAGALAFTDGPCYPDSNNIKACPSGETGKSYSVQITGRAGTGCVPFVTFSILAGTALPPGLSLSSDGLISGTPTTAGTYDFWISMTDQTAANGGPSWCTESPPASTQREFSIAILQGLSIQQRQSTLTPAQLSTPYSTQLTAAGANGAALTWSVSAGSLPAGLTLNSSTGLISGTPTTVGNSNFKIAVTDGTRQDTQTYTLPVVKALKVTSPPAVAAEVRRPVQFSLTGEGGQPAYTWSATDLPDGLTLDAASGAITGVPTSPGRSVVKVTLTDGLGLTTTVDLSVTVAPQLTIVRQALPTGHVGHAYRARLHALGGVAPRTWSIVRGKLPAGIQLNTRTGVLNGAPSQAGLRRLTVELTDKFGVVSKATFVLRIAG